MKKMYKKFGVLFLSQAIFCSDAPLLSPQHSSNNSPVAQRSEECMKK